MSAPSVRVSVPAAVSVPVVLYVAWVCGVGGRVGCGRGGAGAGRESSIVPVVGAVAVVSVGPVVECFALVGISSEIFIRDGRNGGRNR